MKMANPAQPIGVQGVSHLPEFQRLLFGVGREKLSAANHTLQLEMQEYDPKNVTPNLFYPMRGIKWFQKLSSI